MTSTVWLAAILPLADSLWVTILRSTANGTSIAFFFCFSLNERVLLATAFRHTHTLIHCKIICWIVVDDSAINLVHWHTHVYAMNNSTGARQGLFAGCLTAQLLTTQQIKKIDRFLDAFFSLSLFLFDNVEDDFLPQPEQSEKLVEYQNTRLQFIVGRWNAMRNRNTIAVDRTLDAHHLMTFSQQMTDKYFSPKTYPGRNKRSATTIVQTWHELKFEIYLWI